MTALVGLALLLVFAIFATLMFLERISTLLALPLMATTFLVIALVADCLHITPRSGLDEWIATREATAMLMNNRRALLAQLQSNPPASRVADLVSHARYRETSIWGSSWFGHLFGRPPHVPGYAEKLADWLGREDFQVSEKDIRAATEAGDARKLEAAIGRLTERLSRTPAPPGPSRSAAIFTYFTGYFELLLRGGSLTLYATIIATIFGGMFAVYVKNLGIAERVIYWTAEFAGERPFVIASAVFVVTATIFTSVGGLGTVIMIGSIVLPVLRSVGLSPVVGAGVLLIGIAAGGTLNPVSRRLWMDFYGLSPEQLDPLLWTMLLIYVLLGFGWIAWGARGGLLSSFDSEATAKSPPRESIGAALLIAPIIPVGLVYFARMEEISAFVVSIAYMFLCACRRPGAVRVLTRSMIEGAQTVMPPVLLMIGIGMLVTSLATPPVQSYLRPLVESAAPQGRLGYILLFGLAAPLALYRGPLNVWGMGLAVSATLLATTPLPPAAVLGALLAAGMIQGISDPTNTANVWVAGYSGITTAQLLRFTLVPVWIAAIVAVVVFGVWYVP